MSAMVFHMMKRFMKIMVRSLLWMTRIFENWLETLDGKGTPNLERPMINGEEREQVEEANEQGRNDIPAEWEEIPAPDPAPNHPVNEVRRGEQNS